MEESTKLVDESTEALWYVVHTYSGYENKVANDLQTMVENRHLQDLICDVKVPTETRIEEVFDKRGNKTGEKEVQSKLYPGYVFIKMVMNDNTWYIVRNTRGCTGFVGPESKPEPLTEAEVAKMGVETTVDLEVEYKVGDTVEITAGPMEGSVGTVDEIDIPARKVRVRITMFGRELPAELELHQVNLGCADGYLIRFGNTTVLIDGGEAWPNKPERLFPQYLEAVGVTHVDVYIVTHWHLDHCMNVNHILERWGGGSTVVYGASAEVNPDYAPLANGAIYQQMKDGDELTIGGWLTVNCVGPETVKNNGNQNMDSLNFVVTYGQKRILFTGDYAASGNINRKYQDLVRNIDVLKFPHHGILDDKTNTYEIGVVLMRVLSPTYVLIPGAASVWEIWNFIAAYSAEKNLTRDHVYNNRFGNIVLLTDGETIEVCTNVDPADFNPYQPNREVTAQ